jgi:Zinc knuckle
MDLSRTRTPYNRCQYQSNNAYTNATTAEQEYTSVANMPVQQDYTRPRPKGPCFNCGKMGHFAKDCHSNPSANINYMDAINKDMRYVPQLNITPQANITQIKAQINVLSTEDNDALIEAMGSSQDFIPA